jgi:hypothetical protein
LRRARATFWKRSTEAAIERELLADAAEIEPVADHREKRRRRVMSTS